MVEQPVRERAKLRSQIASLAADHALQQALAIALGLRVVLGFTAWEVLRLSPPARANGEWLNLLLPVRNPLWAIVGPWQRWDALWYQHLATSGYRQGSADVNFFPLYPALMHVAGVGLGGSYALGGLLVSTLAFVIALVLLYRLIERDFDSPVASRTVLYAAMAPVAFFYLAPYTEALFLALSVGAFLAARERKFALAAGMAVLATICRLQGIILLLPVAVEMFQDARSRKREGKRPFRASYTTLVGPPLALAGFYLYGVSAIGVPGGFIQTGADHWGHKVVGAWSALADGLAVAMAGRRPEEILNLLAVGLMILALPFMFRRLPLSYALYAAAMLVPVVFQEAYASPLMSATRYLLVVFPAFVLLAQLGHKAWFDRLILASSPVLMGALFFHFVRFGFVA